MLDLRYILHHVKTGHGKGAWKTAHGLARRMTDMVRREGVAGIIKRLQGLGSRIDVPEFYSFVSKDQEIPLNPKQRRQCEKQDYLTVNWLIPEMSVGSGGHVNIFRFVTMLENRGMHNRIYVVNPTYFTTDRQLREFLDEHYNLGNKNTEVFCSTERIRFAHATIATGWQTCYFLRRFHNTVSKFYFVQDFEPCFYAMSTDYLLAENTYRFGFRGITAGDWLKEKLRKEYGMKTDSFLFSYDRNIYKPGKKRDKRKRVFLYARPLTPRRCFELALLMLCRLTEKMPQLDVVMVGWDVSNYRIPFRYTNAGTLTPEELSDTYTQCDICIVMSSTNLSLLPVEIMACHSVAACTGGENNTWMVNENNAVMLPNDPLEMADTLYEALHDEKRLEKLRAAGLEFAKNYTDWEAEGDKVFRYIEEGIREDGRKL